MPTTSIWAVTFVSVIGACAMSVARGADKAAGAEPAETSTVDSLPSIKELPDPFLFADGSRVASPDDWARRRAELLELIQRYEYGHLPPAANVVATEAPAYEPPKRTGSNRDAKNAPPPPAAAPLPEGTTVKKYELTIGPAGKSVSTHLVLTIPPGEGPFPTIVRGDLGWGDVKPAIAAEVARRGYLLAQFDRTEIVPDKKDVRGGLYDVHPDGDFGALAAWAWGYHRVIDYLVTRDDVNPKQIAVTGHSRGGKTAILAGATDERIAITNPNNSGCGGAGCYRIQGEKSEDIAAILKNFRYWFHPDFGRFVGKIDRLPFDQHSVKAVIAPRALLTTEALGDIWANPPGTQQSHLAAKEVYDFLGAGDRLGIYFREGKHEQNLADWQALLDFADVQFKGATVERKFDKLAFPATGDKPYAWSAPTAAAR